jgi:hypothetical protein
VHCSGTVYMYQLCLATMEALGLRTNVIYLIETHVSPEIPRKGAQGVSLKIPRKDHTRTRSAQGLCNFEDDVRTGPPPK